MSAIKGLDSFLDVLAVINNPSAYEQKVKELVEQTRKYQEVVEAVVELSKVNDYTVSIRDREEKSKTALAAAEKLAVEKIVEATNKANAIVEEKKVELTKAKEQSSKNKVKEKELGSLEEELNKKKEALSIIEKALEEKEKVLQIKEVEITERLNKLKSVMV